MTLQELKLFNAGGSCPCCTPIRQISLPDFAAHAPVDDHIDHMEKGRPLKPEDCNGLSIADAEAFHQFRDMDSLHRADAVGKMFHRSQALRDTLQKDGTVQKFAARYRKNG